MLACLDWPVNNQVIWTETDSRNWGRPMKTVARWNGARFSWEADLLGAIEGRAETGESASHGLHAKLDGAMPVLEIS